MVYIINAQGAPDTFLEHTSANLTKEGLDTMTSYTKKSAMEQIRDFEDSCKEGNSIFSGCSPDIRPLVDYFFETLRLVTGAINPNAYNAISNVVKIAEVARNLAMNTFPKEKIQGKEFDCMQGLFDELDDLLEECLIHARPLTVKVTEDGKIEYSENDETSWSTFDQKINCIAEILLENQENVRQSFGVTRKANRNGMIISDLWHLFVIVHFINKEWTNLVKNGFSERVFKAFKEGVLYLRAIGEEPSEECKYNQFMDLLAGKNKMVPVYKREVVGYMCVDSSFSETLYVGGSDTEDSIGLEMSK